MATKFFTVRNPRAAQLEHAIHHLDISIAAPVEHAAHNAGQAIFERGGERLERFKPAAPRPRNPALQGDLDFLRTVAHHASRLSRPQPLLRAPRACAFEVRTLQPIHRVALIDAPVGMVLAHAPEHALDRFAVRSDRRANNAAPIAHLIAPHGAHRLVGQGDNMKPVEADLGLRQYLGHALGGGGAHVHADVPDVVRVVDKWKSAVPVSARRVPTITAPSVSIGTQILSFTRILSVVG